MAFIKTGLITALILTTRIYSMDPELEKRFKAEAVPETPAVQLQQKISVFLKSKDDQSFDVTELVPLMETLQLVVGEAVRFEEYTKDIDIDGKTLDFVVDSLKELAESDLPKITLEKEGDIKMIHYPLKGVIAKLKPKVEAYLISLEPLSMLERVAGRQKGKKSAIIGLLKAAQASDFLGAESLVSAYAYFIVDELLAQPNAESLLAQLNAYAQEANIGISPLLKKRIKGYYLLMKGSGIIAVSIADYLAQTPQGAYRFDDKVKIQEPQITSLYGIQYLPRPLDITELSIAEGSFTLGKEDPYPLTGLFSPYKNLTSLAIKDGKLADVPEGMLSGLGSVKKLDLSGNRMFTSIPEGFFTGMNSLEEINLDNNTELKLDAKKSSTFSMLLPHLKVVSLINIPSIKKETQLKEFKKNYDLDVKGIEVITAPKDDPALSGWTVI